MGLAVLSITVCAAIVAFFALVVVGTLRELSIARTETNALMQILVSPSPPSFLQRVLPDAIGQVLFNGHNEKDGGTSHVLLALSEQCSSCNSFLRALEERAAARPTLSQSVTCVLRVSSKRSPMLKLADRVSRQVIVDETGELFHALEVSATPAMFAVDTTSETVLGHKLGPDMVWLEQALDGANGHR